MKKFPSPPLLFPRRILKREFQGPRGQFPAALLAADYDTNFSGPVLSAEFKKQKAAWEFIIFSALPLSTSIKFVSVLTNVPSRLGGFDRNIFVIEPLIDRYLKLVGHMCETRAFCLENKSVIREKSNCKLNLNARKTFPLLTKSVYETFKRARHFIKTRSRYLVHVLQT